MKNLSDEKYLQHFDVEELEGRFEMKPWIIIIEEPCDCECDCNADPT